MHIKVTDQPLNPQELIEHVRQDEAGAVVLFSGVVRNHNLGRKVECLECEAYPEMAEKVMREIADAMRNEWHVTDIAIQHRTGRLEIGEASMLVAVSSPHRRGGIRGCERAGGSLQGNRPGLEEGSVRGGGGVVRRRPARAGALNARNPPCGSDSVIQRTRLCGSTARHAGRDSRSSQAIWH